MLRQNSPRVAGLILLALVPFTGCSRAEGPIVPTGVSPKGADADWQLHGRTYAEQFYSPLARINAQNVKQLGLAWYLDLPGERTLEATPLIIDGVLYFSGTYGK